MSNEKKEIPKSNESGVVNRPTREERTLNMLIRICRAILRFFERRMIIARQKRLAKMMDGKK